MLSMKHNTSGDSPATEIVYGTATNHKSALDSSLVEVKKGDTMKTRENTEIDDDVAISFPQRLMEVLDNEEYVDIIGWLPHGRAFMIYRTTDFEQQILPKHFNKQSKFSSFTRKMNRWGFVRVTKGAEAGAYYQKFFRKGGHRLISQMSCRSSGRAPSKVVPTPNYDLDDEIPPIPAPALSLTSVVPSVAVQPLATEQAVLNGLVILDQMQTEQLLRRELALRSLSSELPYSSVLANSIDQSGHVGWGGLLGSAPVVRNDQTSQFSLARMPHP